MLSSTPMLGDSEGVSSIWKEDISTTCTIFAESEVVSLVAKGKSKEDILAGINAMTAKKIGRLVNAIGSKSGARGPVFVGGGVGLNRGMVEDLRQRVNRDVYVPEHPQFVGDLGADLLAPRPLAYDGYEYYDDEEEEEKPGLLRRIFGGGSR